MSELEAVLRASALCRNYSANLREDHPKWAEVALECARMIEEEIPNNADESTPGVPFE